MKISYLKHTPHRLVTPLVRTSLLLLLASGGSSKVFATDFTSFADGDWATPATWTPNGNPNTGEFQGGGGSDNVTINGHTITVDQDTYGGNGVATDRFTVNQGNTLTINGGRLTTNPGDSSILIGEASAGTVNVNDGVFHYDGGGSLFVGYNAGGTGVLNIGDGTGALDSARLNGGGRLLAPGGNGTAGANGTVTVNNDGAVYNTRLGIGYGGGSTGVLTLNGASTYQTTGGTALNYVGINGGSTGTLNLQDDATLTWRGTRAFRIGSNNNADGTVNISGNGTLIGTSTQGNSDRGIVVGNGGQGVLNISDNATINIGSSIAAGFSSTGDGWVNHNSGSVSAQNVFMGRNSGGSGTYTMTSGTLDVSNRIGPGLGGTGQFIQNGGTVTTPRINFSEAGAGAGTYTLAGGTLRTDVIDMNFGDNADPDGVLVWGNGTLTVREVNSGSAGSTDFSLGGVGEVVRSGTTLVIDGDVATGDSGGDSVLDLGTLYINNGTRMDILDIDGALDLTGDDTLLSIEAPNFLRPTGVGTLDWGTIPLVTASGGITGAFDDIALPGPDGRNFFLSPFAVSDPSLLKNNSFYFEQTGTQLLFHYKVSGSVPEPGTVSFLLFGLVALRFSRWAFGMNQQKKK